MCSQGRARHHWGILSLLIVFSLLITEKGNGGFAGMPTYLTQPCPEVGTWGLGNTSLGGSFSSEMCLWVLCGSPPAPSWPFPENPIATVAASHWYPLAWGISRLTGIFGLEELSTFRLLCPSFPRYFLLGTCVSSNRPSPACWVNIRILNPDLSQQQDKPGTASHRRGCVPEPAWAPRLLQARQRGGFQQCRVLRGGRLQRGCETPTCTAAAGLMQSSLALRWGSGLTPWSPHR